MEKSELIKEVESILKKMALLIKKKSCKTLRGQRNRILTICGLTISLRELLLNYKQQPSFQKGGVVFRNTDNNVQSVINEC